MGRKGIIQPSCVIKQGPEPHKYCMDSKCDMWVSLAPTSCGRQDYTLFYTVREHPDGIYEYKVLQTDFNITSMQHCSL